MRLGDNSRSWHFLAIELFEYTPICSIIASKTQSPWVQPLASSVAIKASTIRLQVAEHPWVGVPGYVGNPGNQVLAVGPGRTSKDRATKPASRRTTRYNSMTMYDQQPSGQGEANNNHVGTWGGNQQPIGV